jgi:hypothetical protein
MKEKLINIFSIVIACIAFAVVVSLVEQWNPFSTPMPANISVESEEFKRYLEMQPSSAFLWVALGYAVGSLAAGFALSRINQHISTSRITLSGGLMGLAVLNMLTIPHPTWFWLLLIFYFPCFYLGTKIFPRAQPQH